MVSTCEREDAGGGVFGRWFPDDAGSPAFEYAPAHTRHQGEDHWHLLGNDRIVATAHAEGYVQLYDWSRGGKIVNRWHPQRGEYAGGFKFLDVEGAVFPTLFSRLPAGAAQRRIFGAGYFEKVTHYRGIEVTERIDAPAGDDPVLFSRTALRNTGVEPLSVTVVEFWTANLHQLTVAPIMTYGLDKFWQWKREFLNRRFKIGAVWNPDRQWLRVDYALVSSRRVPDPHQAAYSDYYPKSVFLAALEDFPEGFTAYAADGRRFFGESGLGNAPGVRGAADGAVVRERPAYRAQVILALRRTTRLEPGEEVIWRYLYGYADRQIISGLAEKFRRHPPETARPMMEWSSQEAPWLTRELRWHSYYLQAGSLYHEFFGAHFVDQGSAYGYFQGLSGAPRDLSLFVMPLTYLRPDLAKEALRFLMRSQDAKTGALPYAYIGYGKTAGWLVHSWSSDLDLFLAWAMAEYLGATRDLDFLNESLAFYPPARGRAGTVLDHLHAAFEHLRDRVGLGPHGLLRCGTGDWNDVLLAFSRLSPLTIWRGESSLNAGLATVSLPALADAIEEADSAFAGALRAFAAEQAKALESLWTGEWLARGFLGRGEKALGRDRLFLDTQSFPVLGGVWDKARSQHLFGAIRKYCVDPQPAGALCLWPPMTGFLLKPGSDTNGGTWAAIDSWVAWAWSFVDPRAAWDFYLRATLAARSGAYPEVWYGVWSGPDSYNAHYHPKPGETFNFNATPMSLFPVMNMNRHSGPLLDAIKLAGIHPRRGKLVVDPRLPFDTFSLYLPLVGVEYEAGRHHGYYAPVTAGEFRFAVRPPAYVAVADAHVSVNGAPTVFEINEEGLICFAAAGAPGNRVTWEITG